MMSLNQAAQTLQIGKPRLYRLMREQGIIPIPDGNRKAITDSQIQILKRFTTPKKKSIVQEPLLDELDFEPVQNSSSAQLSHISEPVQKLLDSKDSQIKYLQELLQSEKAERAAERKERENYQAILLGMQQMRDNLLEEKPAVHYHSSSGSVLNRTDNGFFGKFVSAFKNG